MNVKTITTGIKKFVTGRKTVIVIVQCRLSSTRLKRKALLPLGKKCVLEWTLAAMKKVKADRYFLAVDQESKEELEGIAKKAGWEFYAGSQKDVLQRFCDVIELTNADVVVRATADNPFLFYDAAQQMVDEYFERDKESHIDYFTYSGLPHGSGVEMFDAHSLLKAKNNTTLDYDHEHVGPSLYNHKDMFTSVFAEAPEKFRHPELRTTIDTSMDYRRALYIVNELSSIYEDGPYNTDDILNALSSPCVSHPVLLIPSVKKGHGTGHLKRCLDLAIKNKWDIFIPYNADLTQCSVLISEARNSGLKDFQIVTSMSNAPEYSMAVTDSFITDELFVSEKLNNLPVVCLDEGSQDTNFAEYLLDIIPSTEITRDANLVEPDFIPLPECKKNEPRGTAQIHNALVVVGGEDPAGLSKNACIALAQNEIYVTAVCDEFSSDEKISRFIKFVPRIENLKEQLYRFDLVVTHYGFTAYESAGAGCAVILVATSPLHLKLSQSYGFVCLEGNQLDKKNIAELLENRQKLYPEKICGSTSKSLSDYLLSLSMGNHFKCPVCRSKDFMKNPVVSRTKERTFRRCSSCSMVYMSWTKKEIPVEYNHSYFYEDYEKQYGKTYEQDFSSIKSSCVRRISIIDRIYRSKFKNITPSVLDVGCALGPFLDAAGDSMWQAFGIDVSKDAVDYVQKKLNYPAAVVNFPSEDFLKEFGVQEFDAVTMWYVIEHFNDIDAVLKTVSDILKVGGVFAFSTPSGSGISARYNRQSFFENSPSDHYSIWEKNNAQYILRRYGFEIVKIVPTGIHGERFPLAKKKNWKKDSLQMKLLNLYARTFGLGDTMEIYCRKVK